MSTKRLLLKILFTLFICSNSNAQGYLFAHMRHEDYGRLYYYISKDAKTWTKLNNNERVIPDYNGHPDIMKGADGRYYMIGVCEKKKAPVLWTSKDLVKWNHEKYLPVEVFADTPGFYTERYYYGAPKLYYDAPSKQYIITWHATKPNTTGKEEWNEMRTFYILTSDFKNFTQPKRLFDFKSEADKNMATIDVIIRKIDGEYYALIKDERWPEDGAPTGKTVRLSKSKNLTGPYCEPGEPLTTPLTFFEAPTLVKKNNSKGWMIFVERYPYEYVCFESKEIDSNNWVPNEYTIQDARHGVIIPISKKEYKNILSAYSK
ncbi:MAG: glycoside hydrolase family 43 protein [Bacteroidales bacterium]